MNKYFVFYLISLFLTNALSAVSHNTSLSLPLHTWSAKINFEGLEIFGKDLANGKEYELGRGNGKQFRDPKLIEQSNQSITVSYPDQQLTVKVNASNNRLHFTFFSSVEQTLTWPILGEDAQVKAIIYPEGEGLYVPLNDKFWQEQLNATSLSTQGMGISVPTQGRGLHAPFWGYDLGVSSLNVIVHNDLMNQLHFKVKDGKLINQLSHEFRELDHLLPFEISFTLTDADLLASAKNYKSYLIETNQYRTLKVKIRENPEIRKLIGAIHAYMWGDGRTLKALEYLRSLGIKHMWLGYEDKPPRPFRDKWVKKQHYVDNAYIAKAKALGYLVGPYDSFHTMQYPGQSDCANDTFDDLYPSSCITLKNGKLDKGFAGRGCHASSEAFALQTPSNKTILTRIHAFVKTGINSYFLDCDATGELFDDYSQVHPMTQEKDRENRIKRMVYIAHTQKMVLGSESAAAWAIPFIAFSHGSFSVHSSLHWPFMNDKKNYGSWWPLERPKIFFQPAKAFADYINARYNPRYRLPLLQTVFHESVIMTDRWEISHMKLENVIEQREILELFYGIPSIWALDMKDLKKHGMHLQKLSSTFSRLHQAIAFQPLTTFKWLTSNCLVQQITFGNVAILTANFSEKTFQEIPPQSLRISWLKEGNAEIYQASLL